MPLPVGRDGRAVFYALVSILRYEDLQGGLCDEKIKPIFETSFSYLFSSPKKFRLHFRKALHWMPIESQKKKRYLRLIREVLTSIQRT